MVEDSLSELYPIGFDLTCKKCELIANTIREQNLEPRTSDLYCIFNGKMSHRTIDKHVKELVAQGYLRRFVNNYSAEISFLLLPDQIYIDMMKKDPDLKWTIVRSSPMFVSNCKILYENWQEILTLECPNCHKEMVTPLYEAIPQDEKHEDGLLLGRITWKCNSCNFSHISPIRTL